MTPLSDSWDHDGSRWKRLLAPRVITWLWLALVSGALLIGIASYDDLADGVRMNQCESIESSARERLIIIEENDGEGGPLIEYWRTELIPDLVERWERASCRGDFPR
jgi:hypothetical protein